MIGASLFGFAVSISTERGYGWLQVKRASPMPPARISVARPKICLVFSTIGVTASWPGHGIWRCENACRYAVAVRSNAGCRITSILCNRTRNRKHCSSHLLPSSSTQSSFPFHFSAPGCGSRCRFCLSFFSISAAASSLSSGATRAAGCRSAWSVGSTWQSMCPRCSALHRWDFCWSARRGLLPSRRCHCEQRRQSMRSYPKTKTLAGCLTCG